MPIEQVTQLDLPHVIIDLANPYQFMVEWGAYSADQSALDPIIEFFLPLRTRIREEHDIHIVATYSAAADKKIRENKTRRVYSLSFCPGQRQQKNILHEDLIKEFRRALPQLLNDLQETLEAWYKAENGLALFLEEGNKESIRNFLISVGLRQPEKTKEQRREDFIKQNPGLARAAQPNRHPKKKSTGSVTSAST